MRQPKWRILAGVVPIWMLFLAADAAAQPPELVDFTFPGGTLKEYVDLALSTFDDFQVSVAPEIESVKLAPVKLKGISSGSAVMNLIPHLSGGQRVMTNYASVGGSGTPLNMHWRVSAPPFTTGVFAVRDYLEANGQASRDSSMKALISAIEAALDIGSYSTPRVKIKLHPDTGLLLIAGTEEQVKVVEQVVAQLQKTADSSIRELARKNQELSLKLQLLRQQLPAEGKDESKQ